MSIPAWLSADPRVAHTRRLPATAGATAPWPTWVDPRVVETCAELGIDRPWTHQAEAAEAAFAGHHVAVATPTASGKSLAYLLPILAATLSGAGGRPPLARAGGLRLTGRATALYLAPTKALAHDQLRASRLLGPSGWKPGTLDGDSDDDERRFARDFADLVLTNPDMLHRSVLPNHGRHARLLGGLRYVVVDEAHRYRGLFGAHLAAVLRRLRRLSHHYGADPVFVLASATMTEPEATAAALIGDPDVVPVVADGSPRPARDIVLLRPDRNLTETAASLLTQLSQEGQTLAFTTSRLQAELVAIRARELSPMPEAIASYRSGYLPSDRRSIEAALTEGRLRGVASTNALELGVDIAGMDAVVTAGFPGTLAAFWQQVGRAGRSGREALAVLAARDDPLDAYLVDHPELIFDAPVERAIVPVENPFVLGPHLAAAAQEIPLTGADAAWFGPRTVELADALTRQGVLRRRPAGWFWTHAQRAVDSIDLRAMHGKAVEVVDRATGRVIGQVDPAAADRTVHPEAVYVHQGETWVVDELDEHDRVALVRAARPEYFTQAQSVSDVRILTTDRTRPLGLGTVHVGTVELAGQVTGYLRRDAETGKVWDSNPLEFPPRRMTTRATWWTLPADVVARLPFADAALPGAVHGAEHTAIGLLPALVPCDRWDIGGLSTVLHPDTGLTTVFVHDGLPGGSGIADAGFDAAERWWTATLDRLLTCGCETGCPACVVSPKCGNGNNPLDKDAAALVVAALIPGRPSPRRPRHAPAPAHPTAPRPPAVRC
ncbi:DEAD/DEAH box helicase [Propioniciclava soli]|uniref:DEAD/DEAH box helicase n=1 Tax=Propioniciclava soli TaxID=2775081 RepID=A0ABZ3CB86_9ACTN